MEQNEHNVRAQRKTMRRIGLKISLCMGITLSFFLSLTGVAFSGHFTLPAWLSSFAISTAISLVIGFVVPMKPLLDTVSSHMKKPSIAASCVESLISDCIYTPVITLAMVLLAHQSIALHAPADAVPPFLPMFIHSLIIEMLIGFILIMIFMPLYARLFIPKENVTG